MVYLLFITALAVSIDSLICGFSLSSFTHKKAKVFFCVCIVVFLMCLTANYLAVFLESLITKPIGELGGFILVAVGLFNVLKTKKEISVKNTFSVFFVSFAVGLDGAMANLSLALMGLNEFYVPLVIALFHAVAVYFGILLSSIKFVKKLNRYSFIPYLILIIMGVYKVLGMFL